MSSLNIKTMVIDCDQATNTVAAQNQVKENVILSRGSEYIWRCNCYSNSYSSVVTAFNSASDTFELLIGNINAAPVVLVDDQVYWNNVSDWGQVNVSAGAISVKMNTYSTTLLTDLGNSSSKEYISEIWLTNNLSDDVLISHSICYINNIPEL